MAKKITVRHKVTGLVSEIHPMTFRALPGVLEEVKPGAKPKVNLPSVETKPEPKPKESKDV